MTDFKVQEQEEQYSLFDRILAISVCLIFVISIYLLFQSRSIINSFDEGVGKSLERAAHASSVQIAKKEIESALNFINNDPRLKKKLAYQTTTESEFQSWYFNLEGTLKHLEKANGSTLSEQRDILDYVNRVILTQEVTKEGSSKETVYLPSDPEVERNSLIGGVSVLASLFFRVRMLMYD